MALGDFLSKLGGRGDEPVVDDPSSRPPTTDELLAALESTERLVAGGAVPSPVTARVERVTNTVRDTIPRLATLGAGSAGAYSVMATATDYLPEAVGGYLRLPRRFADTRPVDGQKTSLMVLVDQLDLLGSTMDEVFDAVCREDANALVVHGRFLAEKFGTSSGGGQLRVAPGETPLPAQPDDAQNLDGPGAPDGGAPAPTGDTPDLTGAPVTPPSPDPLGPPAAEQTPRPAPAEPTRLAPPSFLDL